MKISSTIIVLSAMICNAQTLIWQSSKISYGSQSYYPVMKIDANDLANGKEANFRYASVQKRDTIIIAEAATGIEAYRFSSIPISNKSSSIKYVSFVKNLFSNNNQWATLITYSDSTRSKTMVCEIYIDQVKKFESTCNSYIYPYAVDGGIYFTVTTQDSIMKTYNTRASSGSSVSRNLKQNNLVFKEFNEGVVARIPSEKGEIITWKVVAISGEIITQGKQTSNSNFCEVKIPLNALNNSIYVFTAKNKSGEYSGKIERAF